MDLRIAYAFDNRVPSPQADTEQLVSTVAALSRRGLDVTLVIPRLGVDAGAGKGVGAGKEARAGKDAGVGKEPRPRTDAGAEEIRRFYGVEGSFRVAPYPCPRWPRPLQKLVAPLGAVRSGAAREADLIHTRNLPIALAGIGAGLRVVLETYRPWPDQFAVLRPLIRRLMGHENFVGAILHSRLAKESYARVGVTEERLLVAHNGWEPSRMDPVLERGEARELLGLPPERAVVLYTGRVDDEKGLDAVLEMASLRAEVLFVLVGAKEPDSFTERARGAANVRLVPWQPFEAVSRWLYAADVLLLPPSARPLERHGSTVLPMKLFTYLAAGRPILAPRTPDVTEVLRDGENARLVHPGDAEAAAAALGELLEDGALRERLADGGRRAARGLTWDARAERIHRFFVRRLEAMGATAPPIPPAAPR